MPRELAHQMVHDANITVTSTSGHTIAFKKDVPTHVPAIMVRACLRYGAKPVKRYANAELKFGDDEAYKDSPVRQRAAVDFSVAEETLDASVLENEEEDDEPVFTEVEGKIRKAILKLMANNDEGDFTASGAPKHNSIGRMADDLPPITAATRDVVWDKMVESGDVPDDWFGED